MGEMKAKTLTLLIGGAIALLLVGIVVLIATPLMDEFGESVRTRTNTSVENQIIPNASTQIVVGATRPFLQTLTGCRNATNDVAIPASNWAIIEGGTGGGRIDTSANSTFIWNLSFVQLATMNCSTLEYLAASTGSDAADDFKTGLTIFATFSVIIAIALVGLVIIMFFKKS